MYINFIDYEKAFDHVDRKTLWKLLRYYGVPEKIVNIIRLVVDWIMKTSTSEGKHGIQWTAQTQLDDLDFTDDLALLSHTHEQMQITKASVSAVSVSVGLNIHEGKTKVLKFKTKNSNPITLDGETLEDIESFTYLGSIIDEQGGSDADVNSRIGKGRAASLHLELKTTFNQYQSHNLQYERQHNQFYCMELKLGELQQPTSRMYKYL
ncbi:unnamed protein product [Schistosoma mattheei]|uniref:Uncharacterized protein n=1 Tax=Schistosoma mattheei TaxID=31246 RepID=A0A183PWG2_9TREM|nr:unnamed protein product [Schistosoma mattheei]